MSERDKIKQANIYRYASGEVVNNYMLEAYHQERIRTAIMFLNNSYREEAKEKIKILEIASGDGTVAKQLKELGYEVWASDITITQLEDIQREGINVVTLDASGVFPFDPETFDGIIAGDIIEHLFDVELFMSECYRVLKTQGMFVITTPNLASLQDRFRFFAGKSPKQIQPCHEYYKLHIRPFTLELLEKTLRSFGFTIANKSSNYVIWKIRSHYLIYSRRLAKLFPGLGRSLIVCGKKV